MSKSHLPFMYFNPYPWINKTSNMMTSSELSASDSSRNLVVQLQDETGTKRFKLRFVQRQSPQSCHWQGNRGMSSSINYLVLAVLYMIVTFSTSRSKLTSWFWHKVHQSGLWSDSGAQLSWLSGWASAGRSGQKTSQDVTWYLSPAEGEQSERRMNDTKSVK